MTEEIWKPIGEAPEYSVSNLGRVKRTSPHDHAKRKLGILALSTHRGGYKAVVMCTGGKKITRKVHRLVCEAFNGPCPKKGIHCAHKDGDPANNIPENLYWATAKQNAADKIRHGRSATGTRNGNVLYPERRSRGDKHWTKAKPELIPRGDDHYCKRNPERIVRGENKFFAKLTELDVREILSTPQTFGSGRALADKYGVSMALISAIRKRKVWTHINMQAEL